MSIKGGEDQVNMTTVELIAMADRDWGGAEGASEWNVCVHKEKLKVTVLWLHKNTQWKNNNTVYITVATSPTRMFNKKVVHNAYRQDFYYAMVLYWMNDKYR